MLRMPILLVVLMFTFFISPSFAMESAAKQAIVVDTYTHTVLYEKNADQKMFPSSMSKLMTLYIVFDRLKHGTLKLDDKLYVSEKAWRKGGSKTFVRQGDYVRVDDMLQGIIVQSGNDACIVIAEGLAGSEEAFAEEMNRVAQEIGLTHSHFTNSTGWPDEEHYMTARDLYKLAHHLISDFPEYYHYFSEQEFTYNGITQHNRNHLLGKDSFIDGLKTGHTEAGGYGIVISGEQEGRRLITVVNGLTSEKERLVEAERLINHGFREFESETLVQRGLQVANTDVWMGTEKTLPVVVEKDMTLTIPRREKDQIKYLISYDNPVQAPIKRGQHVGELYIAIPGMKAVPVPLMAGKNVDELSGVDRILPAAQYFLLRGDDSTNQEQKADNTQ